MPNIIFHNSRKNHGTSFRTIFLYIFFLCVCIFSVFLTKMSPLQMHNP
ncbi:hypothetical protein CsSME_00046826 [Camellia sinensis var. sinensis]